ncbi:hypothetical protein [Actinophytocola sp.]|uniref:hypothetical protein n=1 Tax=Actinophytocola sp. TaxID=1872138 RepID=UPI002D800D2C|nr:hypothetical protein [Actinophytocola sp.]HET9140344.1 hypothetical protein [Actinophytocola sp.]
MRLAFLATSDLNGWKVKTYGISADDARPRTELVRAARALAASELPDRPDRDGAFGVGFLIVRDDPASCLVLVDWWAHAGELYQRAFAAPWDRPGALAPRSSPAIGGVCELQVTAHERQAWLRHVLNNPAGWNIDGYLADTCAAAIVPVPV